MGQKIPILYIDDNILAVNKPAGISVTKDRWDSTAYNLLDLLTSQLKLDKKIYPVHRIDKDTSGVLLYALDRQSHSQLNADFKNRKVKKLYHAIVYGKPKCNELFIDKKLLLDGDRTHRTIIHEQKGKHALTQIKIVQMFKTMSLIEAYPITGRTHQIRVHLKSVGLPILCDNLYGNAKPIYLSNLKSNWRGNKLTERPLIERLALHANTISFNHPVTNIQMNLTAPYYKDFKATLNQLKKM